MQKNSKQDCIGFLLLQQITTKLVAQRNTNIFPYNLGVRKRSSMGPWDCISSEGYKGESVSLPFSTLEATCIPCLMAPFSLQNL